MYLNKKSKKQHSALTLKSFSIHTFCFPYYTISGSINGFKGPGSSIAPNTAKLVTRKRAMMISAKASLHCHQACFLCLISAKSSCKSSTLHCFNDPRRNMQSSSYSLIQRAPDSGGYSERDSDLRLDFLNCVYDSLSTMVSCRIFQVLKMSLYFDHI